MIKNPTYSAKSFRSEDGASNALSSTAVDIATFDPAQYGANPGGNLLSLRAINPNSSLCYLKFYDKTASAVDPASDAPIAVLPLQAGPGSLLFVRDLQDGVLHYTRCLSVRCVTGIADTDTTAPSTAPTVEAEYL
jgi:hypothetical protein